jgi:hypothetical protein
MNEEKSRFVLIFHTQLKRRLGHTGLRRWKAFTHQCSPPVIEHIFWMMRVLTGTRVFALSSEYKSAQIKLSLESRSSQIKLSSETKVLRSRLSLESRSSQINLSSEIKVRRSSWVRNLEVLRSSWVWNLEVLRSSLVRNLKILRSSWVRKQKFSDQAEFGI